MDNITGIKSVERLVAEDYGEYWIGVDHTVAIGWNEIPKYLYDALMQFAKEQGEE